MLSENRFEYSGRGIARFQSHEFDPAARGFDLFAAGYEMRPIRAFHEDIRQQTGNQLSRRVFIEQNHGIHRLQSGDQFGAFALRCNRALGTFRPAHSGVGIQSDDEHVTQRAGPLQQPDMARVQQVVTAVGENHGFACSFPLRSLSKEFRAAVETCHFLHFIRDGCLKTRCYAERMATSTRIRQPRHFADFRCIGAECEDTCCDGWDITVDRETYQKYQACDDPEFKNSFDRLVTLHTADVSQHHYGKMVLSQTMCPFLSEGLCSIQNRLGEEYLSAMCATFPRTLNLVDAVLERSLDFACPEAARVTLLNVEPMAFEDKEDEIRTSRLGGLSDLNTGRNGIPGKPYAVFSQVREFAIWLLQHRAYPVWKRLIVLGFFCEKLNEMAAAAGELQIVELLQAYREAVETGVFEEMLNQQQTRPAVQLEIVLELIVARISSDFTNRRFLDCYNEFMQGIEWTGQSSMEEIGTNYSRVYSHYYEPFFSRHEHILEHYLVNYVYETLFPFGPQQSQHKLKLQSVERPIFSQFALMTAYYAIIKTLLIGMAGLHQSSFGPSHVIKLISSFSRTFEHSVAYPEAALGNLAEKGLLNAAGMAILIKN